MSDIAVAGGCRGARLDVARDDRTAGADHGNLCRYCLLHGTIEGCGIGRVYQDRGNFLHHQILKLADLLIDIGIAARVLNDDVVAQLLGAGWADRADN